MEEQHLMGNLFFLLAVHGTIAALCFWIATRPFRALLWAEFLSTLFSIGLIWLFVAAGHGPSGFQTLAIVSFGVAVPVSVYGVRQLLLMVGRQRGKAE
jgi:hypothetical protein